MNPVNAINNGGSFVSLADKPQTEASGPAFSDRLKSALEDTNQRQHVSDQSMEQVVRGQLGIHEGMLNITQADISLRLLTQVRNKAMDAYKEIMNMQF